MNKSQATLLFLYLLAFLLSTNATCTPEFPLAQGWQGADAAYSIPLPDGRIIWIFGDTLYGNERVVSSTGWPRMVHNSLGISSCKDSTWSIEYAIKKDAEGNPVSFFEPKNPETYYWALDGVYHDGNLWITLLCLELDPSGGIGFMTCGSDLAKVSNLDKNAQEWEVTISPLAANGTKAYPSASTVIEGDYLYLFALDELEDRPMIITRVHLEKLEQTQENIEYFAKDGTWKKGLVAADAKGIMKPGASEISVRYHADLGKWIAIMTGPEFMSNNVVARTAKKIEGPWSESKVIYYYPEMQYSYDKYDKDTYCYAAKEHPEFAVKGSLFLTYVCNTFANEKLATHLDIYFPKSIYMPLEKIIGSGRNENGERHLAFYLGSVVVLVLVIAVIFWKKRSSSWKGEFKEQTNELMNNEVPV